MYRDLVKLQDGERQPGTGYNLIVATLVFLAGIISAMILCPGCNTVVQGVNGMAKDALIAAAAVKASTDGGLRPQGQPDSMVLDHETVRNYLEGGN